MKVLATVVLICGLGYAQGGNLQGSYGFLLNWSMNDTSQADNSGQAVIGVMNFDGMGNMSGTYTDVQGADIFGNPSQASSGTLTGTYSGNPDGTGTLNITADDGGMLTFATVTTDGGRGFQMVVTASNFQTAGAAIPLAGSPTSMNGKLPFSVVKRSATGSIPLSLTGTTTNGMTVYTVSGASGSGTMTCNDGSAGTWNATISSLTIATPIPTVGGNGGAAGDFLLTLSYTACGGSTAQQLIGQVNGNVGPNGGINLGLQLPGAVISGFGRAAAPGVSLSGAYGLAFTNSPLPASSVGVLQFDGMGNVTISQTLVGSAGMNGGNQPAPQTGSNAGTYAINSDGSGTMSFQNANGATPTWAFVITDGGSQILFLRTDPHGNPAVAFGTARAE